MDLQPPRAHGGAERPGDAGPPTACPRADDEPGEGDYVQGVDTRPSSASTENRARFEPITVLGRGSMRRLDRVGGYYIARTRPTSGTRRV